MPFRLLEHAPIHIKDYSNPAPKNRGERLGEKIRKPALLDLGGEEERFELSCYRDV